MSWTRSEDDFRLEGEIPQGTRAEVLLPPQAKRMPERVELNGQLIWRSGKARRNRAVEWIREENEGLRLLLAQSGKYELSALY